MAKAALVSDSSPSASQQLLMKTAKTVKLLSSNSSSFDHGSS